MSLHVSDEETEAEKHAYQRTELGLESTVTFHYRLLLEPIQLSDPKAYKAASPSGKCVGQGMPNPLSGRRQGL